MKIVLLALVLLSLSLFCSAQTLDSHEEATRLNNQAATLAEQEKEAEALRILDEALALDPRNETIAMNKAVVLRQAQRFDEALVVVDKMLRRFPSSRTWHIERFIVLQSLELFAEAHREWLIVQSNGADKLDLRSLNNRNYMFRISPQMIAPQPKEIRLDGFLVSATKTQVTFEAFLFASSNGQLRFVEPKSKTISLKAIEPEFSGIGAVPAEQLRPGDFVIVVGKQEKEGFRARRINVGQRSVAEEKKRGSLFNAASVTLVEDQNYPDLNPQTSGPATFTLAGGKSVTAEVASLVRNGDRTFLVTTATAFLSDEERRIRARSSQEAAQLLAQQLRGVKEVRGLSFDEKPGVLQVALPVRVVPGTPFGGGEVVCVGMKNAPAAVPLATANAKRGEVVYVQGWYDGSVWWREAVVAYANNKRLFLHINKQGEEGRILGSLIVNKKGEVVGLQVEGVEPYISGVSVTALRQAVNKR